MGPEVCCVKGREIGVCMCACAHICVCECMCVHACVCVWVGGCACVCMHACVGEGERECNTIDAYVIQHIHQQNI